ncbi:MAG: alpha/beta hydrolase [Oliverpabstia sp.]
MISKKQLSIPNNLYEKNVTIYDDPSIPLKADILYFHGGGLLYGQREDLPQLHIDTFTQAGFRIIAFDYPLAPSAKLNLILEDACASVNHYLENPDLYGSENIPYFLWGRSAGAYLCLLIVASGKCKKAPKGLLSYYGYGFLCDGWFLTPSKYYTSLPTVDDSVLASLPAAIHAAGDLDTHYGVYVYARQTGKWIDLIYSGREKYFYLDYTLRTFQKLPCPLFCTHSIGDTDVPYSEFLELCAHFQPKRFIASCSVHDFDRDESSPVTEKLLHATLEFLEQKLSS